MLECETIKKGMKCPLMTKKGCSFNGGRCHPIVENCEGCAHVLELEVGKYCKICPDPSMKWRLGKCNFATHLRGNGKGNGNGQNKKINPLKAAKRNARAR